MYGSETQTIMLRTTTTAKRGMRMAGSSSPVAYLVEPPPCHHLQCSGSSWVLDADQLGHNLSWGGLHAQTGGGVGNTTHIPNSLCYKRVAERE